MPVECVASSPVVELDRPTEDMPVHAGYTNNNLTCGCRLPVVLIKDDMPLNDQEAAVAALGHVSTCSWKSKQLVMSDYTDNDRPN